MPPFDSNGVTDDPPSISPVRVALHTGAWGHSFFTLIFHTDRIRTGGRYRFGSVSCMNSAR